MTPRSLTVGTAAELQPLRDAGYEVVLSRPGELPSEDELLRLVPGVTGWLAGVEPISAAVIAAATDLRVIARNGAGTDNVDSVAAGANGVVVTRAAGANAQGVAELTLSLAMACLRHVPWAAAEVRSGGWQRWSARELSEITVGVVGLGAIGRKVAWIFTALGARVVGHDPFTAYPAVQSMALDDLLAASDVVTLHAPPPADGSPLLDARRIALLPHGAIVINTARASLVDDVAVLRALESDALSAYAVDAFATEPPTLTPLLLHPRVLATPHLGAFTTGSVSRATSAAVASILDILGT